jgi:hypothetical protein
MTNLDVVEINKGDTVVIDNKKYIVTNKEAHRVCLNLSTGTLAPRVLYTLYDSKKDDYGVIAEEDLLNINNLSVEGKGCINLPHIESNLDRV